MSSPLCGELRILSLLPNLDVITPEIGLISVISISTLALDEPDTYPDDADAVYTTFGASYNFETHLSTDVNSFVFVSYFSTIPISFLFTLFLSFNFFLCRYR